MTSRLRTVAWVLLALSIACAVPQLLAKKKEKPPDASASEQKRAVHALNRLAFGPRPGEVQQVMAMGVDNWIDLQLHPEKIPDTAADSRVAGFRTLRMSSKEIAEEFPDNQMIKQVMDGKKPMPTDAAKRAIYRVQIARLEEKKERKEEKPAAKNEVAAPLTPAATVSPSTTAATSDAAPSAAEGSAKTAEELAAAAAASGDETGNAPNNLADPNAMNTANAAPASPAATIESSNVPASEMPPPAAAMPTPAETA